MSDLESIQGLSRWKPYPAYKDSAVEWLGEIPKDWKVKRLKDIVVIDQEKLSEKTHPDYELLYVDISNVDSNGNINDLQDFVFEEAPSRARKIVKNGDTILSTVRTYLKAIAYIDKPPKNLIVSTGFAVLHPKHGISPMYLWRLVQSKQFVYAVVANSEGVSYPAITPSKLACLPTWIPSIDEQYAIAAFLDRETAKIDALIAKKQRLIELLQEKRTALISQAVTKGLDPDAPMKDSGVEWIDRIPLGWIGTSLKRWVEAKITDGPHETPDFISEGIPFVSAEAVQDGKINFESKRGYISPDQHRRYSKKLLPRRDDVFLVKSGATTGKVAKVETDIEFNVWSPMTLIRADTEKVIPDFVYQALQSEYIQKQIQQTWSAGTQPNIAMGDIERIFFVAPSLSLQEVIVNYIKKETTKIDGLIVKVKSAIQSLQEYRTALISAAVTGKINVTNNKNMEQE